MELFDGVSAAERQGRAGGRARRHAAHGSARGSGSSTASGRGIEADLDEGDEAEKDPLAIINSHLLNGE
jgi:cobalamin-dependent methionine synthase I